MDPITQNYEFNPDIYHQDIIDIIYSSHTSCLFEFFKIHLNKTVVKESEELGNKFIFFLF